jgi:hypothetical protein
VTKAAWASHLCIFFSKELDILLDRLDNQCMMHDS